tara:strand:- start:207 stop:902 length:696 start_codon:yes stop_codon:yes gene_type:complete
MYQIFFHIASITILEICFFFYYVGPLETDIFLTYIRRILQAPIEHLDNVLEHWNISREEFIHSIYLENENSDDIKNQLYQDSLEGKKEREEQNEELFFRTLEYWTAICATGILLFLLQYCYEKCWKNRKQDGGRTLLPDPSMSSMEMHVIRRNSLDSDDGDEYQDFDRENEQVRAKERRIKALVIGLHYLIYGGSIITFQYLFFKYIVFEYKPLSIEEIKYYIYNELLEES